jgi:type IV fimbrial biogenesis protein FimT
MPGMLDQSLVKTCGFSLVELMVTVSLLAFLGLCAGTLIDAKSWMAHYRLRAAASDLATGMQTARITAVKRNMYCTITFNQDIEGINYDFVIYEDLNRNLQFDAGDDIVAKKVLLAKDYKGVSLTGVTFVRNELDQPSLAFDPRGFSRNKTGGFGAGTVSLADGYGNQTSVVVNQAGRVRTE